MNTNTNPKSVDERMKEFPMMLEHYELERKRADELQAKNTALQAEVERLKEELDLSNKLLREGEKGLVDKVRRLREALKYQIGTHNSSDHNCTSCDVCVFHGEQALNDTKEVG
jgi:uncharacterized small protein (DUF1192 family)